MSSTFSTPSQSTKSSFISVQPFPIPSPMYDGRATLSSFDHILPTTLTTAGSDDTQWDEFPYNSNFCLDERILEISKHPVTGGGYSDIWAGKLDGSLPVAIKIIREFNVPINEDAKRKLFRRIWREYLTWARMSHPNILPFLGYTHDFTRDSTFKLPALVSPWMDNGSLAVYIVNNPEAKRLPLLLGVGRALEYLHKHDIVHGDLRAVSRNILVSADGTPYLTDFGLSRSLGEVAGLTTTSEAAGTLRWMAPELLYNNPGEGRQPFQSKVTKASDVWAYGMTILEVLTGKEPYDSIATPAILTSLIILRKRPERPDLASVPELTDDVWSICLKCWAHMPPSRPSIPQVTRILNTVNPRAVNANPPRPHHLNTRSVVDNVYVSAGVAFKEVKAAFTELTPRPVQEVLKMIVKCPVYICWGM
ncbi:hypothetical protein M422DRAFT_781075 [Sphaerobolus stellatus SS14]|uniref:Protein kinase domain-containing protein n=1 Tax=Sphaerobolus stellatus (strain SS14) TaxID=990650 RepID=A0A0C9U8X0_SPHS4|nr:hypothetical protein M422DRAFT_781075 [Sphaerobolus stellatus SS14]